MFEWLAAVIVAIGRVFEAIWHLLRLLRCQLG